MKMDENGYASGKIDVRNMYKLYQNTSTMLDSRRFRFHPRSTPPIDSTENGQVRVAKECGLKAFNIPAETASFTVGSGLFLK